MADEACPKILEVNPSDPNPPDDVPPDADPPDADPPDADPPDADLPDADSARDADLPDTGSSPVHNPVMDELEEEECSGSLPQASGTRKNASDV